MSGMVYADSVAGLGRSQVDEATLSTIVAKALHTGSAEVLSAQVSPVDYPIGTVATAALLRVAGTARDREGEIRDWTVFVKELQSAAVWPFLHVVPEPLRAEWAAVFPWRLEIDAFEGPLADVMPEGMRMAELYQIREIDEHRAAIWMEDVQIDPSPWTVDRFAHAARLLGALAGRRPQDSDTWLGGLDVHREPGAALHDYATGRVEFGVIPPILDDSAWESRPLLRQELGADEVRIRAALRAHAGRLHALLDRLDQLPQTFPHGDASPQNLLVPVGEPETFVVIDWGFNSPQAVGFDLGQLLLGLVNADQLSPTELPGLEAVVVPAYTDGLLSTGFEATPAEVREGFVLSVVVRSLFTTLGLDEPPQPDTSEAHAHVGNRIGLTNYLLDLAEECLR